MVKNTPANVEDARDVGLIPGSERSPGVGNGTHSSILAGKSMGRGAWWAVAPGATKSWT